MLRHGWLVGKGGDLVQARYTRTVIVPNVHVHVHVMWARDSRFSFWILGRGTGGVVLGFVARWVWRWWLFIAVVVVVGWAGLGGCG